MIGPDRVLARRSILALGAVAALAACAPGSDLSVSPTPAAPTGGTPSGGAGASGSPTTSDAATPVPSVQPHASTGGPAVEVAHGPRASSSVALTFHGAGEPRLAQKILDAAHLGGAAITVLAVGTWLQSYPQMGRQILAAGHELGNHTWHHRPMRQMDEASAYAEIVGGQQEIARFTTSPTWFRPSGTPHATPHILAAAGRAGYATSLAFDVDPRDYADPGPALVVSRVLADVRAGSIISLHLGHAGTVEALPKILAGLASRGLGAVTISALLTGVSP